MSNAPTYRRYSVAVDGLTMWSGSRYGTELDAENMAQDYMDINPSARITITHQDYPLIDLPDWWDPTTMTAVDMDPEDYVEVRIYRGSGNMAVYHVPYGEMLDLGRHYVTTEWRS